MLIMTLFSQRNSSIVLSYLDVITFQIIVLTRCPPWHSGEPVRGVPGSSLRVHFADVCMDGFLVSCELLMMNLLVGGPKKRSVIPEPKLFIATDESEQSMAIMMNARLGSRWIKIYERCADGAFRKSQSQQIVLITCVQTPQ